MSLDLSTPESLQSLVDSFRSATIPAKDWTHAAHLAVAAAYLQTMPFDKALNEFRLGIQNLNASHGLVTTIERGYHESLTRFWLHICNEFLRRSACSELEAVRHLVETLGQRSNLWRDYYSQNIVRLPEARFGWLMPDTRPSDTMAILPVWAPE